MVMMYLLLDISVEICYSQSVWHRIFRKAVWFQKARPHCIRQLTAAIDRHHMH